MLSTRSEAYVYVLILKIILLLFKNVVDFSVFHFNIYFVIVDPHDTTAEDELQLETLIFCQILPIFRFNMSRERLVENLRML